MTHRKRSLAGAMLAGTIAIASLYGLLLFKSNSHAQQIPTPPLANKNPVRPEEIASANTPPTPNHAGLYVGVAGCAAAACHGGPADPKTTPRWQSAYTHWFVNSDPHAAAYSVLKTERSKRILWLLDQGHTTNLDDATDKPWLTTTPNLDNRCITCHSIQPNAQATLSETVLMDGVSCEACHGPAQGWKASHTTNGWVSDPNRYEPMTLDQNTTTASTKMWNTKDPVSRAAICARCHVGGPDRDVNHDLIAAGHPRLNFEYAAFMQNYSHNNAHWDDKLDREAKIAQPNSRAQKPADYETRLWFIGQLTSMQASLKLLQLRVDLASKSAETKPSVIDPVTKYRLGHQRPAWPELSEFDCYACHHDLNADSWRRAPEYRASMMQRYSRTPGTIPWGTWYFNDVSELLLSTKEAPLKFHGTNQLNAAMEKLYQSKKEEIPPKTASLMSQLNTDSLITKQTYKTTHTAAQIQAYCQAILNLPVPSSWDEAVQRYLALVAFNNSLESFNATSAKEFSSVLKDLHDMLIFEENQDGPKLRTKEDWKGMLEQFNKLKGLYNTTTNVK